MAPTIVLVPGMASVGSVVYAPLIKELSVQGFKDMHPVDLPSIDCLNHLAELTPNPLEADITAIRKVLMSLVDKNKDILIVAHSYGGTPALAAAEGLWKHMQDREGNGGVMKAVLLSSSLAIPGESIASDRMGWSQQHNVQIDTGARIEDVDGTPIFYPDGIETGKEWFNDLPDNEQEKWSAGLRPTAVGNVMSTVPDLTVGNWENRLPYRRGNGFGYARGVSEFFG